MSKRDISLLLDDMLIAANKIRSYTNAITFDQFLSDDKTVDATVRNFEIVGEAANRIPTDFKLVHPEIDWSGIVGRRNRIIQEYFGVDYEILWHIKNELLEELIGWIQTIKHNDII